jgi:hypothetical protein
LFLKKEEGKKVKRGKDNLLLFGTTTKKQRKERCAGPHKNTYLLDMDGKGD